MTRAQAESILVGRRRRILEFLELSTAQDGTNPDLAEPLARAVRLLGGTTADPSAPTDAEMSAVVSEYGEDRLLDAADIYLDDRLIGNWDEVSYSLDGRSEQVGQLFEALLKAADRRKSSYADQYGADPGTAASGPTILGGRLRPTPWAGRSPREHHWSYHRRYGRWCP